MNTGIKTLCRKVLHFLNYPNESLKIENYQKLPNKGIPYWKLNAKIYSLKNYLRSISEFPRLNEIHNRPIGIAIKTWKQLLPYNPNNIGNWSGDDLHSVNGTQKIEKLLINTLINLYGGSIKNWQGYITNGGTESNLYTMWIGRNKLIKKYPITQICVIKNDLTHYSITKNSNILHLNNYTSEIDKNNWNYDIYCLEKTIIKLIKKNYHGFIIPITLGYTQTGTNDNYSKVHQTIKKIKKEYYVDFYIFIDAALNGFVLPFSTQNFYPLKLKDISSFSVDLHKAGMTPLPCGVILYRRTLVEYIKDQIPYSPKEDLTISGSRSGIPSVAAYMTLMKLGKNGYKKIIEKSIKLKNQFIEKIKKTKLHNIQIIDNNGISIGIISSRPLPVGIINKYGLFSKRHIYHFNKKKKSLFIYKATFIANV